MPSCRATGATALARLGAPTADELGYAKALRVSEIGGTTVVVLEQDATAGAVSTVVLRASTDQLLDDLERAIDDGVNTYKVLSTVTHIVSCYNQAKEDRGIVVSRMGVPLALSGLDGVPGGAEACTVPSSSGTCCLLISDNALTQQYAWHCH
jgi:hypothetical protein